MIDLSKQLIKAYENSTLAHFYIIRPGNNENISEAHKFLTKWIKDFLSAILSKDQQDSSRFFNSHPDILFINPLDEAPYKINDPSINEFFKFLSYRPFELKHRFIIINKAHLIGNQLSNKFLVSFENPPKDTTIFLLAPLEKSLLATITSRAITLNIQRTKPSHTRDNGNLAFKSFYEYIQHRLKNDQHTDLVLEKFVKEEKFGLLEFTNFLKLHKESTKAFIDYILDYERLYGKNYQRKQKVFKELQWFEKSQLYSNAATERIASLLEQVLPQI